MTIEADLSRRCTEPITYSKISIWQAAATCSLECCQQKKVSYLKQYHPSRQSKYNSKVYSSQKSSLPWRDALILMVSSVCVGNVVNLWHMLSQSKMQRLQADGFTWWQQQNFSLLISFGIFRNHILNLKICGTWKRRMCHVEASFHDHHLLWGSTSRRGFVERRQALLGPRLRGDHPPALPDATPAISTHWSC